MLITPYPKDVFQKQPFYGTLCHKYGVSWILEFYKYKIILGD